MPAVEFDEVFAAEITAINDRRQARGSVQPDVHLVPEGKADPDGHAIKRPDEQSDLVGLALSGGGVRSASFCMGALQALNEGHVFPRIDYLSTVSGGGYIGTSMVAAMSETKKPAFPFPSDLTPEELPAIRHIRDHSNYLFPRGAMDAVNNLAIYLRGIVANIILLLPYLLLAAILTVLHHPKAERIRSETSAKLLDLTSFEITLKVALTILALLVLWAVYRSIYPNRRDVGTHWTLVCGFGLVALLLSALYELQLLILTRMFNGDAGSQLLVIVSGWFTGWLPTALAFFSAIVGLFSSFLANLIKAGAQNASWPAWFYKVLAKGAIYLAAAAVPLLLWFVYLNLAYWGIGEEGCLPKPPASCHAPDWLWAASAVLAKITPTGVTDFVKPYAISSQIFIFYVVVLVATFLARLLLNPNANSLHRLYRDRLSKAFLFDPGKPYKEPLLPLLLRAAQRVVRLLKWRPLDGSSERNGVSRSCAPLDDAKLSSIDCACAPYPIINAALNIRGSRYANQRGRNADFFVFTPKYTGSRATGYVTTSALEKDVAEVDLAAAMAISGAAASSNMGANTIKVLSPTLAILNVRLGFWLPNPRVIADDGVRTSWKKFVNRLFDMSFFNEMFGWLKEDSDFIYLTDGGHIENLGIYELLRRRCALVIAVDAEADPQMSFDSFIALQRHALIDLGVRISLPWSEIRDHTRAASKDVAETGGLAWNRAPHGPHVAIGEIKYPGDRTGVLLYIKSSLTGDENDYIIDYKRRNPDFPHERTADQFFSEEQFEAYRALGFHAVRRALQYEDQIATSSGPATWAERRNDPLVARTLELLFGTALPPAPMARRRRRTSPSPPAP